MLESVSFPSLAFNVCESQLKIAVIFLLQSSAFACIMSASVHSPPMLQSLWAWMFSPILIEFLGQTIGLENENARALYIGVPSFSRMQLKILGTANCREGNFSQSCLALHIYTCCNLFAGCRIGIQGFLSKSVGCQPIRTLRISLPLSRRQRILQPWPTS